jgi:regulator of ribonuclease activity A
MAVKTADLCDRFDPALQVCDPLFRDFGGKRQFQGGVVTVKCYEDNSLVKVALAEPGEGRVLVVDAGGSMRCAMLGDQLAASAVLNGWGGIILYGCIRDTKAIAGMALGVKALGSHPRRSVKRGEGRHSLPVNFASVTFKPGDFVYCDEDGILVSAEELTWHG